MDIWKHSELSALKFGGKAEDYLDIHKFLDASKLFYFNVKHRVMLHHTFGVSLCIEAFGDLIPNSARKKVLTRDIACEHLKEDLGGQVPTLSDWFSQTEELLASPLDQIQKIEDPSLRNFLLKPYLFSGIENSLLITWSDFGVALTERFLGVEKALALRAHLPAERSIKKALKKYQFSARWQYSPDVDQLNLLTKRKHEN
jgi:hypothetical protein